MTEVKMMKLLAPTIDKLMITNDAGHQDVRKVDGGVMVWQMERCKSTHRLHLQIGVRLTTTHRGRWVQKRKYLAHNSRLQLAY